MSETPLDGGPRRRALVTGASAGIGESFARRLARDAFDLTLVARSQDRLVALARELEDERGIRAEVRAIDLTDEKALSELAEGLAQQPPDLLVNNAGFGSMGRFAELDPVVEDNEIRLNVLALSRLTRAVLPGMLERGHGGIINVSSLAGEAPAAFNATYGATKAFVTSFSEALYEELRDSGVKVQALLPGFTRTGFQDRAGVDPSAVPDFAWMTADAVVEASLAALEKGDAVCVPGLGNRVLGLVERTVPRPLIRRLIGAATKRNLD